MLQLKIDSIREILDSIHDALFIIEKKSKKIVYVNRLMCKMFNCSIKHALTCNISNICSDIKPYTDKEFNRKLSKTTKEGKQVFEWIVRNPKGKVFWVEIVLNNITIDNNKYIIAFIRDISDRKNSEKEKQNSLALLQAIFDSSLDAIGIVDNQGKFINGNKTLLARWDKKTKHLIGQSANKILPEPIFIERLKYTQNVIKTKKAVRFTDHYNNQWFEVSISPVLELDGSVNKVAMFSRNITEQKELSDKIGVERDHIVDVLESMSDAFISLDKNWCFVYMNAKAGHIFKRDPKKIIGKNIWEEFPEAIGMPFRKYYEKVMKTKIPINIEEYNPLDDQWLENTITPTRIGISVFFHDISARKKVEMALLKSEERYRSFVQCSGEGICLFEFEKPISLKLSLKEQVKALYKYGYVGACNDKFAEMYGFSKGDELVGKKLAEFHGSDNNPENIAALTNVAASNYRIVNEVTDEIDKNGNKMYVSNNIFGIIEDGYLKRVWASQNDVTEQKRITKTLEESEKKYRLLIESATDSIVILKDGLVQYVNHVLIELSGYTEEELIGKSFIDFVAVEEREKVLAYHKKRMEGEIKPIRYETYAHKKNGEKVPFEIVSSVYTYKEEKANLVFMRDISERKRAEEEIRKSRLLLRTMIDSLNLWLAVVDLEGNYLIANQYYTKTFNLSLNLIENHKFEEHFEPELFKKHKAFKDQCLIEEKTINVYYELEFEKGKIINVFGNYTPLRDNNGKIFGISIALMDITKQKEIERQILVLNQTLEDRVEKRTTQLENANKELEAFAYSVSHDLRAPLRAISGFTKILYEDYFEKFDEEGKRLGNIILNETIRMGQLIDDLLQFSRLGRTAMHLSLVNMKQMAQQIFEETKKQYPDKEVHFVLADLLPVKVDIGLIRQVWINLLSNAFKFSAKKEKIEINISCIQNKNEIIYSIQDNGAGFDMKYIDKLFGVFQRLHNPKDFQGTGVGLAIVQRIIARHDGRIWAESEIKKGTTFYFLIPKHIQL